MPYLSSLGTWMQENIAWVFSGVGVVAVSALGRLLWWCATAGSATIRITSPESGACVQRISFVSGVVRPRKAEVAVIVHPMATAQYWVQRRVSVRNDGTWKVQAYFGTDDVCDAGEHFEIVAVAAPRSVLSEADILAGWPNAKARSDVVEVVRA